MKNCFAGVVCFLFMSLAAGSAQSRETQPVNLVQLTAWVIAGVPGSSLMRVVREHKIAEALSEDQMQQLEQAGAEEQFLHDLSSLHPASQEKAPQLSPLLLRAAADAKAQRYHDAELGLRAALAPESKDAALHFAVGSMLIRQERWDDAFDEISLSGELMPDFPENHKELAYIFYRLDDGPNAIAEARTALSMDPQNAEAYQFLGLALYSNGQYGAAVHAYDESLAREANNADTYFDIGIALHAGGNSDAAIAAYRRAIQLRTNFWEAHSNLGLILHEQNHLAEAIAEYSEARRLAPEEASVRNNLGNTYCDEGDFAAAMVEFRELYREHPEWQQGHSCLARAYLSRKEYDSAIEELHLAVQLNPTSSAEHRLLGEALVLDEKLDDGVRELQLAVSLNPDSDAAHQGLGTALFREQQLTAAEKEFREAIRLNASADNHFSLAACLITMDRYEEALRELDAATRLQPDQTLYRARREELQKLMQQTTSR